MRFHSPQLARLLTLAVLVAGLAGCQSIAGIQPVSQVRVIDASPDAPALDLYQNSAAGLYSVGFGTVSSYIPVAAGTYTHAVYTAGTQQQLASVHGSFVAGNQYTVLAGNVAANLQLTVLKDQSNPAPSGQVALRFLDQATRSGAVDIYLLAPGSTLAGATPTVSGVSFGRNTGYIDAPSGTYSIVVVRAGMVPTNATAPIYTGSQAFYASGSVRTILLIDQQPPTTPGLQIISADDYDAAS
ncbi:MAG: DUF4397 domain-containing protein [Acidobacteriaceae bacterium]|nr:DUF4397 domain-containing protein [Acidobacteriaceae bacterium]